MIFCNFYFPANFSIFLFLFIDLFCNKLKPNLGISVSYILFYFSFF